MIFEAKKKKEIISHKKDRNITHAQSDKIKHPCLSRHP